MNNRNEKSSARSKLDTGYTTYKFSSLCADAVVLEAGGGAAVLAALGVQREQLAGQHARQALLLVRRIVHAGGGFTAKIKKV